jgi:hypothetical protein
VNIYRKFYIENEKQERFDLNSKQCLFTSPSGLGLAKGITYIKVGNVYATDNQEDSQNVITGTLIFIEKPYENYKKFIDFIEKSTEIRLVYIPRFEEKAQKEYFRDVDFVDISKGELAESGVLECPISMNCKSLFYISNNQKYSIEMLADEPRFDSAYWGVIFNDYSNREITIDNIGHVEAAIRLEMWGYLITPKVELWHNDKLHAQLVIDTTIEVNEQMLYSSVDNDLYIHRLKADGTKENLIGYLDLNNDNFFKLPKGVSIIKLTADNGVETKISLEVLTEYKAV